MKGRLNRGFFGVVALFTVLAAPLARGAPGRPASEDIRHSRSNLVFRPEDRRLFKTFHPLLRSEGDRIVRTHRPSALKAPVRPLRKKGRGSAGSVGVSCRKGTERTR